MKKIRVAIVGIGNCASSFVQAIYGAYTGFVNSDSPGFIHKSIGGYRLEDIEISAAFDVNRSKVGKDLSEAIFAQPNCTTKYFTVPYTNITVYKSPVLDGVAENLEHLVPLDGDQQEENVAKILLDTKTDVLVNLLPVGSTQAVAHMASSALDAGVAFINCMPELIASNPEWSDKFLKAKLPVLGDDMKSQLGATTLHRSVLETCLKRGAKINNTYQLNFGGNTDFLNMQNPLRKKSKKFTKTNAIDNCLPGVVDISVGPSDYIPFMKDNKVAYIRIEGELLLGMKFSIETRLSVEDSPNAAGIIIDAVRLAKIALDKKMYGTTINSASAFLFKNPPKNLSEEASWQIPEEYLKA